MHKRMLLNGAIRLLVLALPCSAVSADGARLFTRADSVSYSAANPLTALTNFLVGPAPDDGRVVILRNSVEFGLTLDRFEFSLLHRNDYNLRFTPDTAQFAYLNKNNLPVPYGLNYAVELWANQYQLSGARLGYRLPLTQRLDVMVGYSHLYATEAVSGYMGKYPNGEGGVVRFEQKMIGGRNNRVLEGDLYASYHYTSDLLFRRNVDAPTGQGYSLDVGFVWRVTDRLQLEGTVQDALGAIYWEGIPYTEAVATSEIFVEQEDGVFRAYPNFSGQQSYRNFSQSLTRREQLKATYVSGRLSYGYHYDRMRLADFHRVSVGYLWSGDWGVNLLADVSTGGWGLKLLMPAGELFLMLDDARLDHVHNLRLGWNLGFSL